MAKFRSRLWDQPPTRRLRPRYVAWLAYYPFRVYFRAGDRLLFEVWWRYAPLMARLEEAVGVNSAERLAARHAAAPAVVQGEAQRPEGIALDRGRAPGLHSRIPVAYLSASSTAAPSGRGD